MTIRDALLLLPGAVALVVLAWLGAIVFLTAGP